MLLLGWIGQRGMEVTGQMKVMAYAMPIVFTFLFLNFPSGLNLYYASMNFASLPQQLYLSRERQAARQDSPEPAALSSGEEPGSATPKAKKEPVKQPKKKKPKSKKRGA